MYQFRGTQIEALQFVIALSYTGFSKFELWPNYQYFKLTPNDFVVSATKKKAEACVTYRLWRKHSPRIKFTRKSTDEEGIFIWTYEENALFIEDQVRRAARFSKKILIKVHEHEAFLGFDNMSGVKRLFDGLEVGVYLIFFNMDNQRYCLVGKNHEGEIFQKRINAFVTDLQAFIKNSFNEIEVKQPIPYLVPTYTQSQKTRLQMGLHQSIDHGELTMKEANRLSAVLVNGSYFIFTLKNTNITFVLIKFKGESRKVSMRPGESLGKAVQRQSLKEDMRIPIFSTDFLLSQLQREDTKKTILEFLQDKFGSHTNEFVTMDCHDISYSRGELVFSVYLKSEEVSEEIFFEMQIPNGHLSYPFNIESILQKGFTMQRISYGSSVSDASAFWASSDGSSETSSSHSSIRYS